MQIWSLQDSAKAASEGSGNKSFEELVLEKIKGTPEKVKKCRKVDLMTKIMKSEEYARAIKEKEVPPKKTVKGDKQNKKRSAGYPRDSRRNRQYQKAT